MPGDFEWPDHIERTDPGNRESIYGNNATVGTAARDVLVALDKMHVDLSSTELQTHYPHRRNDSNVPLGRNREPYDPGVVLRFPVDGEQVVIACDRADSVRDNLIGIREHLNQIEAAYGTDIRADYFIEKPGVPTATP